MQCVIIKYPYKNKKIHPSVPFTRKDSLFFNILKVLFQNNITAEVTICDLIDVDGKDRRSIANECYDIVKNNLEKNAS